MSARIPLPKGKVFDMADDDDLLRVNPLPGDMHPGDSPSVPSRGRGNKGHQHPKRKLKDFFKTIAKRTETSNAELARKGLPYRFRIYQEGDEVYIDVAKLDAQGKIETIVKRRITNENFDRWIEDVSAIEGLFFDQNA